MRWRRATSHRTKIQNVPRPERYSWETGKRMPDYFRSMWHSPENGECNGYGLALWNGSPRLILALLPTPENSDHFRVPLKWNRSKRFPFSCSLFFFTFVHEMGFMNSDFYFTVVRCSYLRKRVLRTIVKRAAPVGHWLRPSLLVKPSYPDSLFSVHFLRGPRPPVYPFRLRNVGQGVGISPEN